MIQCNRCHLQYIGETKRRLKDRFNEHRHTLDNANTKSKPTTVAEHFLSSPHNISKDRETLKPGIRNTESKVIVLPIQRVKTILNIHKS